MHRVFMYRGMIRAEHGVVECLVIIRQTDRAAQIDLADIPESQRNCVRYVWTATHADARTHAHTRELGGCGWLGGCLVYCCRVCHSATHLLRHKSTLQSASRAIQNPIAPRRHPRLLLAAFVERLLIENPVPAPGDENECNVRNGSKHRGKLKDDSDDVCTTYIHI